MSARPSRPWRLALTTPGAPIYEPHRSEKAVYEAAAAERQRAEVGTSRVTRIRVDKWDTDGGRWTTHEHVWSKGDPK